MKLYLIFTKSGASNGYHSSYIKRDCAEKVLSALVKDEPQAHIVEEYPRDLYCTVNEF